MENEGTYSRLETTNSAFLRRRVFMLLAKRHNHKDPTQLKMRIQFPLLKVHIEGVQANLQLGLKI